MDGLIDGLIKRSIGMHTTSESKKSSKEQLQCANSPHGVGYVVFGRRFANECEVFKSVMSACKPVMDRNPDENLCGAFDEF